LDDALAPPTIHHKQFPLAYAAKWFPLRGTDDFCRALLADEGVSAALYGLGRSKKSNVPP